MSARCATWAGCRAIEPRCWAGVEARDDRHVLPGMRVHIQYWCGLLHDAATQFFRLRARLSERFSIAYPSSRETIRTVVSRHDPVPVGLGPRVTWSGTDELSLTSGLRKLDVESDDVSMVDTDAARAINTGNFVVLPFDLLAGISTQRAQAVFIAGSPQVGANELKENLHQALGGSTRL